MYPIKECFLSCHINQLGRTAKGDWTGGFPNCRSVARCLTLSWAEFFSPRNPRWSCGTWVAAGGDDMSLWTFGYEKTTLSSCLFERPIIGSSLDYQDVDPLPHDMLHHIMFHRIFLADVRIWSICWPSAWEGAFGKPKGCWGSAWSLGRNTQPTAWTKMKEVNQIQWEKGFQANPGTLRCQATSLEDFSHCLHKSDSWIKVVFVSCKENPKLQRPLKDGFWWILPIFAFWIPKRENWSRYKPLKHACLRFHQTKALRLLVAVPFLWDVLTRKTLQIQTVKKNMFNRFFEKRKWKAKNFEENDQKPRKPKIQKSRLNRSKILFEEKGKESWHLHVSKRRKILNGGTDKRVLLFSPPKRNLRSWKASETTREKKKKNRKKAGFLMAQSWKPFWEELEYGEERLLKLEDLVAATQLGRWMTFYLKSSVSKQEASNGCLCFHFLVL